MISSTVFIEKFVTNLSTTDFCALFLSRCSPAEDEIVRKPAQSKTNVAVIRESQTDKQSRLQQTWIASTSEDSIHSYLWKMTEEEPWYLETEKLSPKRQSFAKYQWLKPCDNQLLKSSWRLETTARKLAFYILVIITGENNKYWRNGSCWGLWVQQERPYRSWSICCGVQRPSEKGEFIDLDFFFYKSRITHDQHAASAQMMHD